MFFFLIFIFFIFSTFLLFKSKTKQINWKHQIILISGGSFGLGNCLVTNLTNYTPKLIIILDIQEPKQIPKNCVYYKCDLSNQLEISKVIKTCKENHGNITILINNVGIVKPTLFKDNTFNQFEKVIKTNFMSAVSLTMEVLPEMMLMKNAHIVYI